MGNLSDLIRRGAKEREQSEVDAIVGSGEPHGRGRFSQECAVAQRQTAESEFSAAQQELLATPELVDTAAGKGHFFSRYRNADITKLRELVDRAYASRHPGSMDDNTPAGESTQFVRRSRPF